MKKVTKKTEAPKQVEEVRVAAQEVPATTKNAPAKLVIKRDTLIKIIVGVVIALLLIPILDWVIQTSITSRYAVLYKNSSVLRSEYVKELEKQYGSQIEQQLLAKAAVNQAALEKKITVSDDEVNQSIEADKQRLGITSEEQFKTALEQSGVTLDDYRDYKKLTVTLDKVMGDVVKDPTDEEIKAYFTQNSSLYTGKKLEDVKDSIKSAIKETAMNTKRQQWVSDAVSKFNTKNNLTTDDNKKYGFLKSITLVKQLFGDPNAK